MCPSTQSPPSSQETEDTDVCVGKAISFTAGMRIRSSCHPPQTSGDYNSCYEDGTSECAARCFSAVAINASSYYEMGVVLKKDGSALSAADENDFPFSAITKDQLEDLTSKYILHRSCNAMRYSDTSMDDCKPQGPTICSSTNLPLVTKMVQAQESMMNLQKSGECDFGMGDVMEGAEGGGKCSMLSLKPSNMMYFLCGTTQTGNEKMYCGDWVGNPDGQCSARKGDQIEGCSLANGPIRIQESECAGNAFQKKFVRGSDDNPYCGPLLRGSCCVASMFFALTDSDEQSLWPLCVRTWATQTCGVDLSAPCTNDEVEETLVVEVRLTITSERRLGDSLSTKCTNKEAELLSRKLSAALHKTSAAAQEAAARPIVISDSSCLAESNAEGRTVVTDFVVQGRVGASNKDSNAAHLAAVSAAAKSPDFQTNLKAAGIDASNITVKVNGKSSKAGGSTSGAKGSATNVLLQTAIITAFAAHGLTS